MSCTTDVLCRQWYVLRWLTQILPLKRCIFFFLSSDFFKERYEEKIFFLTACFKWWKSSHAQWYWASCVRATLRCNKMRIVHLNETVRSVKSHTCHSHSLKQSFQKKKKNLKSVLQNCPIWRITIPRLIIPPCTAIYWSLNVLTTSLRRVTHFALHCWAMKHSKLAVVQQNIQQTQLVLKTRYSCFF